MKFVTIPCSNKNCVSYQDEWRKGRILHKLYGSGEKGKQVLSCDLCDAVTVRDTPDTTMSIKKQSWPYENQSTGTVFHSREHEKSYVKEHNLDAI